MRVDHEGRGQDFVVPVFLRHEHDGEALSNPGVVLDDTRPGAGVSIEDQSARPARADETRGDWMPILFRLLDRATLRLTPDDL
jgi:hypothetical protein